MICIFSCAIACFIFGCDNSNGSLQVKITPNLIGKGDLYGNGAENIPKQNIVIKNSIDWTDLINAMNTVNNVSYDFTEVDIDFNSYQIVAAFDNVKQNAGHSIDIVEIIETENSINIRVVNLLTGGLNSVITQPFHIVKIPKSPKPVVFNTSE
jgi:hypothetical protein